MRKIVACVLMSLMAGSVPAEDCVVGTGITNIRPDGVHAVSSVFSVALYQDVKSCNEALAYSARNLPLTEAAKAYAWDSFTFDCHVPSNCHPTDEGALQPFSRVVYMRHEKAPAN